jgi:hypothetical protein
MDWLFFWGTPPFGELKVGEPPERDELLENLWSIDNAPRKRMMKLLWQLLVNNSSRKYFTKFFRLTDILETQISGCGAVLLPMQTKLRWVLDAWMERSKQDQFLKQGAWGEDWWLPSEQVEYVRAQLKRARLDLLEDSSDYEHALHSLRLAYCELPTDDPNRSYVGDDPPVGRVFVEDRAGKRFLLPQAGMPFSQAPGCGWPQALSILADAAGGSLKIAELYSDRFAEVLSNTHQEKPLRISRPEVLEWLTGKGVTRKQLAAAMKEAASMSERCSPDLALHKMRIEEVHRLLGLVSQRFDAVPPDFECALYVDLMQMFQRTGWVMRCSRCEQPIPGDRSPLSNRQRARWQAGRPVYHEHCSEMRSRERKRADWAARSADPKFRAQERERARNRRKQTARKIR